MSDAEFVKAAKDVKNLKKTPNDDELLQVYGLYKQASIGDVNTEKPAFFDLKGNSKWNAWNAVKGKSTTEAKKAYVEFVNKLVSTYGLK